MTSPTSPPPPDPAARVNGAPGGEDAPALVPPQAVGNGKGPGDPTAAGETVAPGGERAFLDGSGNPIPVEGDGYEVSLDAFEGPLDLLLYLIRRDELDVTDIPIARITEQYLATIGDLGAEDLDRAGEYLLMAATLMRIKAKMLIPSDPDDEDDEDAIDPREELVRRLLEYREFKRVAEGLGERQEEWRGLFARSSVVLPEVDTDDFDDPGVTLIDLFTAFQGVLDNLVQEDPFEMQTEEYSVEIQMQSIRDACARRAEGVPFSRLFDDVHDRGLVITTFLALLEVIREREIVATQADRFGEIWLRIRTEVAEAHD